MGSDAQTFLRSAVRAGPSLNESWRSALGAHVKDIMERGDLVPDDVVIAVVADRMDHSDAANGFVLDGFPRTVAQAAALDAIIEGRDPLIIVDIAVAEAELIRRLGSRTICEDCGAGDAAVTEVRAAA